MQLPDPLAHLYDAWHKKRRDALRLGTQAAVSASLFYLIMQWLGLPEILVGAISAVYILQESSDDTIRSAASRLSATVLGSIIAILCIAVLPHGYGTAVALLITLLIMGTIAALKPNWQYGMVAAIALALGSEKNLVEVSVDRGISIGLGAAVGLAVALLVWPDRASKRYERHVCLALKALADRLEHVGTATSAQANPVHEEHEARYQEAYRNAREAAEVMRLRPANNAQERLRHLQRLHNSIIILDRTLEASDQTPFDGSKETFETEVTKIAEAIRELAEGKTIQVPKLSGPAERREGDRQATVRFGLVELNAELEILSQHQETA